MAGTDTTWRMEEAHFAFLIETEIDVCCTAALVYILQEMINNPSPSGEATKECLKPWKKTATLNQTPSLNT